MQALGYILFSMCLVFPLPTLAFDGLEDTSQVQQMCATFLKKASLNATTAPPLVICPDDNLVTPSLMAIFALTGSVPQTEFVRIYQGLKSHPARIPYAAIIVSQLTDPECDEAKLLYRSTINSFQIPAELVFTWNLSTGDKSPIGALDDGVPKEEL